MSDPAFNNYYFILQVDPQAEHDVIDAAYRRLIAKYHPDQLAPHVREDPITQQRIRAIVEAYRVLKDPHTRAQYDARRASASHSSPAIEQRVYPARCSRTRQEFDVYLARGRNMGQIFRVVGMSPVRYAPASAAPTPACSLRAWFIRALKRLVGHRTHSPPQFIAPPPEQALLAMFDERLILDFGLIDWAGFACPVCDGNTQNPNGTLATWTMCGKCSRLACAGAVFRMPFGGLTYCPWCGARRPITYSVRLGTRAHKHVRGIREPVPPSASTARSELPDSKVSAETE